MTDPQARTAAAIAARWADHQPLTAEEKLARGKEYRERVKARRQENGDTPAQQASDRGAAISEARRLKREAVEADSMDVEDVTDHRLVIECAALLLGRPKLGKWAKELIRWHMDALVLRNRQILDGVVRMNERAEEDA
jgi:hypothetical protein